MIANRVQQQKELQDKITETGKEYNICFLAASYGVSIEAIKVYFNKNNRYPLLYYYSDNETDIVNELNMIERLLKIKKITNG